MAAVTAASPSTSPSSPSHRKPLPIRNSLDWPRTEDVPRKPLPTIPLTGSTRLHEVAATPVRVDVVPNEWPVPSNVKIETVRTSTGSTGSTGSSAGRTAGSLHWLSSVSPPEASPLDRDLPRTPEPPPPPPHSPDYDDQPKPQKQSIPQVLTVLHASDEKPLPPLAVSPALAFSSDFLSPLGSAPSAISSLDFGFSKTDSALLEADEMGALSSAGLRSQDPNRHSQNSDATSSATQPQTSTDSSATTSASSVSGINETSDCPDPSADGSPESSLIEGNMPRNQSVPLFQYHHQPYPQRVASVPIENDFRTASQPDLSHGAAINRHLTPSSTFHRRSSLTRPQSAYSMYSDGARGRSPNFFPGGSHMRAPSAQSRRSPETRPSSYAELLNVPYPQPAPAPVSFDNSQLRNAVGNNASLLSTQKTLEMYRQNVKKTNDFQILYSFAIFLISTAQEQGLNYEEKGRRKVSPLPNRDRDSPAAESSGSPHELVREARSILQKLANSGYPFAQYYLADGYASGLFSKGKEDYNSAFPLFVLAAKHGHAESAYRTALCYEFGWGCRKDPAKSVQFLRTAASKRHPGAMTRLGKACLSGDLGEKRYREGIKWLKLATESADTIYNAAPYHLGCLYETGYGDDIFRDESYAAELFTQAADLGHADASYRMGDAYEHGHLNCPRDPALSVHFYTGAAERGHAGAMMGLCAWYMVGAEPILEKDEEEAYEWARRSAELGYVKAQYAVGYFTEMGIGCRRDILEANVWYVKAADAGDERAKQRLATIRTAISGGPDGGARHRIKKGDAKDDKECIVM